LNQVADQQQNAQSEKALRLIQWEPLRIGGQEEERRFTERKKKRKWKAPTGCAD
jgi:hypothetical protein